MHQKSVLKVFAWVETLLLAQRLFWGRQLCGAKSKELGLVLPAADLGTQTAFDFLSARVLWRINAPLQPASFSQNTRISLAKTFQPLRVEFAQFFTGHNMG
jgi:hypothetical protein